jgi:hypothetical protein
MMKEVLQKLSDLREKTNTMKYGKRKAKKTIAHMVELLMMYPQYKGDLS